MANRIAFISILVAMVVLLAACGDRDNPADPGDVPHGLVFDYVRQFNTDELNAGDPVSWANYQSRNIVIYTPPGYVFDPPGEGRKFPALYLLHDFMAYTDNGASFMYNQIGLTADRLIASGEMQPMLIIMADMSTPIGGSFYSDGWTLWNSLNPVKISSGNFEKAIYRDLIRIIEQDGDPNPAFNIIPKRESRAIGGVGMGGYGAFRIALKNPELFSSISSIDGFVAFDDGIEGIIDQVFTENGITAGDRDAYLESIDTSYFKPYTNLFYSMAGAFSPHDSTPGAYDLTFMSEYGVDLPFDQNGDIVDEVWQKWLDNDITVSLLDDYQSSLTDTKIYFEYGVGNQYNSQSQAQALAQKLDALGIDYESASYSGYEGYPARHGLFNFERLAEILKFHSKYLSDSVD
jgi:S-formylglutathione hydrolase FrmB